MLIELGYPEGSDVPTVHWVMSHPEMEVLVAVDGQDKPIGMLSLAHRPQLRIRGRVASIDELIVAAAWRRRGVGRALVRNAIERARVLNANRLDLIVEHLDPATSQAFAEACGFQSTPTRTWYLNSNDLKIKR
jgi:GNAT superfamily N-acetyltransferase